ncbi:MAG: ABC transporter permease, partial [Phycisphaerales bacterium]|nr:ABC transporter permease [Phycisphaerales bacterium]
IGTEDEDAIAAAYATIDGPVGEAMREAWPEFTLGSDVLGRSLFVRVLTGGGISLGIGICAALLSVFIGTVYGTVAAYAGGRLDAIMMRIVDILYGLPYILLVVLLAVASDALLDEYENRTRARETAVFELASAEASSRGLATDKATVRHLLSTDDALRTRLYDEMASDPSLAPRRLENRTFYDVVVLLVAIGGVSWLTMARVIRGQVLSLKAQPFVEAARALGVPLPRMFLRHLLPNLLGPIIVYTTLTVPQAILQESFLSFLGIGVKPPLPSWGNLAADGLSELNSYKSHWWLLLFPCLLLGVTLLALNFVGEGLREALDPKRTPR